MLGHLGKMLVEANDPIDYYVKLDEECLYLNSHIGANVTLIWTGTISCINCGNKTRKSYNQGHCYPCFKKLASCDLCVMSPERCHYDSGPVATQVGASHFTCGRILFILPTHLLSRLALPKKNICQRAGLIKVPCRHCRLSQYRPGNNQAL